MITGLSKGSSYLPLTSTQRPQRFLSKLSNNDSWKAVKFTFDGVDDYIYCGNHQSLQVTDNIQFSATLTTITGAGERYIASKGDIAAEQVSWLALLDEDNKFIVVLSDDGSISSGHNKVYKSVDAINEGDTVAFSFVGGTLSLKVNDEIIAVEDPVVIEVRTLFDITTLIYAPEDDYTTQLISFDTGDF